MIEYVMHWHIHYITDSNIDIQRQFYYTHNVLYSIAYISVWNSELYKENPPLCLFSIPL